jgi:hypothetical protein
MARLAKILSLLVVISVAGGAAATAANAVAPRVVKRLDGSGTTKTGRVELGRTILLKRRQRESRCKLGAMPDRRCSPGTYYSGLTKGVICSPIFHTTIIRRAPLSEKHAVEQDYGLAAGNYGRALQIDHIVPLSLGGTNSVANLYPEEYSFAGGSPGFRVKDGLENRLHAMVCAGRIGLRSAQRQIAANWERLYRKVFGVAPTRKAPVRRHAKTTIRGG